MTPIHDVVSFCINLSLKNLTVFQYTQTSKTSQISTNDLSKIFYGSTLNFLSGKNCSLDTSVAEICVPNE